MPWEIERRGNVAIVTMTTNKVNAQNPSFFDDLHNAFHRLEADFADCAVVLTGRGKVFSAGLDFDHHFPLFARRSISEIDEWFKAYRATNLRIFQYPRPTVAAINGHAYAGGLITALDCDLRIAADGPLEFALNEVPIGIPMPAVYVEIIKYATGSKTAAEMTLFGRVYDADAALRLGVLHQVVPADELMDEAVRAAASVDTDCHPAYAFAKRALQADTLTAIDAAAQLDAEALSEAMSHPGSLRAHAKRFSEIKGAAPSWTVPA